MNNILEEISVKYPNCKCVMHGNFLDAYTFYLDAIKYKPIKLLEIGVRNGTSLLMWNEYFDNADIYGIDIEIITDVKCATLCCADQTDELARDEFVSCYGDEFDIIIEDGGTTQVEKITAFELYFPLLKSGGLYFIDHTQHSYEARNYGGHLKQDSLIEYLKHLIDDTNLHGRANRGDPRKAFNKYEEDDFSFFELNVDFVHFYCGLCVIGRRKNV